MPIQPLSHTFANPLTSSESFETPSLRRAQSMRTLKRISFVLPKDEGRGLKASGFEDDMYDIPMDLSLDKQTVKSFSVAAAQVRNELQNETFLSPAVVKRLEEEDSATLLWLRSSAGFFLQCALFATYVGLDAGNSIFKSKAMRGTSVVSQSVVMMQSLIQFVLATVMAFTSGGMDGVKSSLELNKIKKFGVLAVVFGTAQMFNTMAYKRLSAGTIKVVGQVRLLQTALLSKYFLGRSYTAIHWAIMTMVMLSACIFCIVKSDVGDLHFQMQAVASLEQQRECILRDMSLILQDATLHGMSKFHMLTPDESYQIPEACRINRKPTKVTSDADFLVGVAFVYGYLLMSDLGSIVSEKYFKEDASVPFYAQKVAIEVSQLPVGFIFSFIVPYINQLCAEPDDDPNEYLKEMWWLDGRSFFQGWSTVVVISMLLSTGQSWLSGLVVKQLSSVLKIFGKLGSVVTVYVINDILMASTEPPLNCSLACCLLVLGTYVFLGAPKPAPQPKLDYPPPEQTSTDSAEASASHASAESTDVEMPRRQ